MSAYIGQITFQAFADANANYLKCEGQNVSRTTYAELFAIVGTTYGVGNGSTTFGLPDLQGRIPLGAGNGSGLSARSLGDEGGQETITDVPLHNHMVNADNSGDSNNPNGRVPATAPDVGLNPVNTYGSSQDFTMASYMIQDAGEEFVNIMNPFVVVQAVICYQITVPSGDYRYLEDLTATAGLDDVDIMYVTKSPSTTPLSRKITWANIKATLLSWLQTITTLFVPISTPTALTDGASVTVNCASTDNKMFTLSASNTTCTLALSNLVDGHTCQIIIAPQSTATFTFTFTHAGLTMKVADAGSADWALDATSGKYYRVFVTRVGSNGFISFDSRSY